MAREAILRFTGDAGQLNRTFALVESQAARSMAKISAVTAGASSTMASKMSGATAAVGAMSAKTARMGKSLSRSVSLPMAALGALGIKGAMDYEKSMNVLQAASSATGGQMADFGKLAQALGADVKLPGTSAGDAAEAMTELSKAGLSINDVMAATRGVLQLSAAGGLSNADAATTAANALNAFGLKGDQAGRVADLLAGAANASSAEVADLALAVADGGAVFASAGVPLEDFITMTAQLAKKGVSGATAGTALKTMMQKLQNPAADARGALATLGQRIGKTSLSLYDMQGRMKPTTQIIDEFTRATKGLSAASRGELLTNIFGADGFRGAEFALTAGVDAFQTTKGEVTKLGAAENMATAKSKGLGGALDGLRSSLETLALKVLVPALPALTNFVNAIANFVPKLSAIPKPILVAAAAFGGLLLAAGPLLAIFGALLSPIGIIGAAIAGLGAIVFAALNPEKAGAMFNAFRAKWDEMAPGVLASLSAFGSAVWGWLQVNGPIIVAKLASWAQAFVEWVVPLIPPLLEKLGTFLGSIGTWITDTAVPDLAKKLKDDWIPAFVNWAADVFPPLLVELGILLGKLVAWVHTDALPAIAKAAASLGAGLVGGLAGGAMDLLGGGGGDKGKGAKGGGKKGGAGGGLASGFIQGAAATVLGPAAGVMGFANAIGLASGTGGIITLNRPTAFVAGEAGREDLLAVPHSRGGIGGGGLNLTQHFNGVPLEEAMERAKRDAGWRLALIARR